jgi:hypothetical protein
MRFGSKSCAVHGLIKAKPQVMIVAIEGVMLVMSVERQRQGLATCECEMCIGCEKGEGHKG